MSYTRRGGVGKPKADECIEVEVREMRVFLESRHVCPLLCVRGVCAIVGLVDSLEVVTLKIWPIDRLSFFSVQCTPQQEHFFPRKANTQKRTNTVVGSADGYVDNFWPFASTPCRFDGTKNSGTTGSHYYRCTGVLREPAEEQGL